ncbi:hypothetical protein FA95DRAFT_1476670, partial [Auriscalpium vulgare]
MESLRSRKQSVSRPKGAKPAVKLSKPSKDARKSRVDDKIKKRMSMRYADISTPRAIAVPSVPSIPAGLRPGPYIEQDDLVSPRGPTREEFKVTEDKLLDADVFDPDAYLKVKLANSTEAELRNLQSSLQTSKDGVAADLQRNVFKNYAEFVLISKEISTLENEMLELKESLAEWRGMPSVLHIDESTSAADRRRNVRSSIADLRVLYANQMQTLHTQIEGSAKFVPTTPGRHVVAETDGISSLNAATYKPVHSARFVLLDDAVLVARKKRRRNASESEKWVAERCWPLNEMLVLDTKDTATLVNVFKIRHGKETHVYRTETASDKRSLLAQFRHVAEELATKKRKEREGEHERRKSMWNSDRGSLAFNPADLPPVPDWMADLTMKEGTSEGAKEKADRDARWVGEFADELTVAISLREWDRAVDLVEQGQAKVAVTQALAAKLTPLTASLTASLLNALSSPQNHKSSVVRLISLLLRLGAGAAARTTFLAARSETIRKLVRMIRFEGHIGMYINDLAMVMFTAIKHTADWFLASFKENEVASSFIEWAKVQIESYGEMFRRQVFSSDVDQKTVDEALQITQSQSRKLLQEYGLDFRFLLTELLTSRPKEAPLPPAPVVRVQPNAPALPPRHNSTASVVPNSILRNRSPAPNSTPSVMSPSPAPPVPPVPASMTVPASATRPSTPSTPGVPARAQTPNSAMRSARASPAPPPRSTNRPGSAASQRPPP